jgi:chitodextrinase
MFVLLGALVVVLALGLGGCMTVPPTVEVSADRTSGYAPLTVAFSAVTTCADKTRAWSFGDGGTSSEENPIHVYQNVGTYTATVTVTNSGMCGTETASDSITITVGEKPFVRITSINIDLNPVCKNIPTRVSAVIEHSRPITYEWSSSDGHVSSDSSTTFTFGSAGTKTIYLTVRDDAGTVAYKTATLKVEECCDPTPPCPDDPCDDPCDSIVLDRLEPERGCVSAYDEFEIAVLFNDWPCFDECDQCRNVFDEQSVGIQGIVPCPSEPDCGCGCNKTKISWDFAWCCGDSSPVLGDDFEIVKVWGDFGQYIKVKFFHSGTWTVTASLNGEEVTGRYEVTVQ